MDPPRTPRTVELASSILATVNELENHLKEYGLQARSFKPETSIASPLPPSLNASVEDALSQMEELAMLLVGPMGWMATQLGRSFDMISMHAMYRYKIPQNFAVGETVSIPELARRCDADEETFTRLIQHAVPNGCLLVQPEPGYVAHTALSAMLASSPGITDWVGYICEDLLPAGLQLPNALTRYPGPPALPHQTGHNLATGKSGTFWETLANDPARSKRFASSMSLMQKMPGWQPTAALEPEIFDWGALDSHSVVVDVGGGDGTFAFILADRHPKLEKVIVQDMPTVIEQVRTRIPEHLHARVELQACDFFRPQPVQGADVYFLRKILHDWPDDFAIKILRQIVPALKDGARILINDHVVPPPGVLSPYQEWQMRGQDLAMMALFNSKERTRAQWEELIRKADTRFHFKAIKPMPPGPLSLIELVWNGP